MRVQPVVVGVYSGTSADAKFGLGIRNSRLPGGPEGPIDATLLIALFLLVLVALPALAVYASSRIRRLEIARRPIDSSPQAAAGPRHLAQLEAKLSAIEQRLAALETHTGIEPRPAPTPVPPRVYAAQPAPAASRASIEQPPLAASTARPAAQTIPGAVPLPVPATPAGPRARGAQLEKVLAERWLIYVGIIAMLFATAFFIKYTFDNHWVGPRGRVAVGLLCGSLIVVWSDKLLRSGYRYFSEGIAGLGASVLYLSIWGAWHYYRMFAAGVALGGMVAVTTAMAAISIGRDSQRLIFLALAGGFLTPLLLARGQHHEIVLFTYVAVLSAGMLAVERWRRWVWLPPLTFLAAQAYYWFWFAASYRPDLLGRTLGFATLFFLVFSALPLLKSRRTARLHPVEFLIVAANLFFYLGALRELLWPDHRWLLTGAFLLLAAAHLAVRRAVPPLPGVEPTVRRLFATLSLVCVSLAIPARLDHAWLTIAWAVEGAIVVWSGARMGSWRLRIPGMILLSVAALRLLVLEIPAPRFLWNARFATFAIAVACFALSAVAILRAVDGIRDYERKLVVTLLVAVSSFSLLALSLEVWDLFGRLPVAGLEHRAAQQMALSVLWTIFAAGLILAGILRKSALLRWEALSLFALVIGKVFLYDLSSLERFYRILSFLVLGILLLVVSFLYQRRSTGQKTRREEGDSS